jgi:hypothetical protein
VNKKLLVETDCTQPSKTNLHRVMKIELEIDGVNTQFGIEPSEDYELTAEELQEIERQILLQELPESDV